MDLKQPLNGNLTKYLNNSLMFYCHIHHWCSAEAPCPVCSTGYSTTSASTFNNGGQIPAYGNERSAQQLLREKENEIYELKCAADVYTCKIKELESQLEGTTKENKKMVNNFLILTEALLKINTRIDPNADEQKAIAGRALKSVGAIL
jgi:hypothetical protein